MSCRRCHRSPTSIASDCGWPGFGPRLGATRSPGDLARGAATAAATSAWAGHPRSGRAGSYPTLALESVHGRCGSQTGWGTSAQRSSPSVSLLLSVATGPPSPASLANPSRPALVPGHAGSAVRELARAGAARGTSEGGGASRGTLVVGHVSWGPWTPPVVYGRVYG